MAMRWIFYFVAIIAIASYFSDDAKEITRKTIVDFFTPVNKVANNVEWVKENAQSKRPNVILIVVDDLGYNDLNYSPNIQSIYKNGVKFNNAYAAHATCAPSRAAIMTGKPATQLGVEFTPHPISLDMFMYFQNDLVHNNIVNWTNVFSNPTMDEMSLNKNETLISNVLRDKGYANYYIGKWHLGGNEGHTPIDRGFDESLSFSYGASVYGDKDDPNIVSAPIDKSMYDVYMSNLVPFGISHNNGKMFKPDKYMTDYLSDSAANVIKSKEDSENPFFITLAYNAPHNPYQALLEDYEKETGEHHERVYKAMIKAVDRGVGKVLDALKETGKYDNTMIMFTSDNGGTHLIGIDDINYPYNGWKCTFFEGGVKVPMFLQWPNMIPKGIQYNKTVSHIDIFHTITSVVNYESEHNEGTNLVPHVLNKNKNDPHDMLFWRSGDYKSIKVGRFKFSKSDRMNKEWLFDLENDPKELNNLINHIPHNETLRNEYQIIKEKLIETNNKQKKSLWNSPIMTPIPVYGSNLTSKYREVIYWEV